MEQPSIVAVPVTPFAADGSIDEPAVPGLLAILQDGGIDSAAINGNTGEYYALSSQERQRMIRCALDAAGSLQMLVGVGGDVPTAVTEAQLGRDLGAVGVMVHQPAHPYVSADGWIEYHAAIAQAVPELALVPYVRSPLVTGPMISELHRRTGAVAAVKYAVRDPERLAVEIERCGDASIAWLCGLAERWAPFFAVAGAVGLTSGLANVAPAGAVALQRALAAGDHAAAMETWHRLLPFETLRARHDDANNVAVVKEALHILGACRRDVRPPATVLSRSEQQEVAELLPDLLASGPDAGRSRA